MSSQIAYKTGDEVMVMRDCIGHWPALVRMEVGATQKVLVLLLGKEASELEVNRVDVTLYYTRESNEWKIPGEKYEEDYKEALEQLLAIRRSEGRPKRKTRPSFTKMEDLLDVQINVLRSDELKDVISGSDEPGDWLCDRNSQNNFDRLARIPYFVDLP